uniref:ATP synthase F0 subunit 6 n=1 Tax=Cladotaenia vulturi TaxID=1917734 RepID=A0A1J0I325_9CEST|nr:ATP synthase F0 subunit 6 [Cladotaenia vulturi]APC62895.1 ATP synthase F0 subunit 6 [Cladotaenia vulturi]
MFSVFNGFNSMVSCIYNYVVYMFSYYHLTVLLSILFTFLVYRFPYCYSLYIFVTILIIMIFSMFLSMFFSRIICDINGFFSCFIPVGTPIYICLLVCLAEAISYIIRPIVLILRPFINISLGCIGAVYLGSLCLSSMFCYVLLCVLFFYEVFVALVHWYIVISILSFSIDH